MKKGAKSQEAPSSGENKEVAAEVDVLDQQFESQTVEAVGEGALDPDVRAGRRVLDPMTRMPYFLPSDDLIRLSLCFPEADEQLKAAQRLDWSTETAPEEVKALMLEAAKGGNETMKAAVLANFDYMGYDTALFLTGLKMNAQYRKAEAEAETLTEARRLYIIAMASLSCPFKQLMRESETKIGTVVNNFPAVQRLGNELAEPEVCGCWFLLKAAVATWEDKYMFDQKQLAKLKAEDPPNGSKIKKQEELVKNTQNNLAMWQEMSGYFGASPQAQAKMNPEMRFLDKALGLPSETDVRFFAVQTFCSAESIASGVGVPETELRERLRRLQVLAARLNPGNYGGIAGRLRVICDALHEGTKDEVTFYQKARAAGLCKFETYEMPITDLSALRQWENEAELGKRPKRADQPNKREPLPKPKRRDDLDWYNVEMREEELEEFKRTSQDKSIEDPETWDSTIEVNEVEAAAFAQASGDGFMGISPEMVADLTKGLDGTDEEVAAFDKKLEEDEALFLKLLEDTYKPSIGDKEWDTGSQVLSAFDIELTPEGLGMSQADFNKAMKDAEAEFKAYAKKFNTKEE